MPYYHKLGQIPRKHHIWFHRNGAAPSYKNEGIAYEARHHHARVR